MEQTKENKIQRVQATFITSAATASQFIEPNKPMIAVCGKSNVGKSSFINMLAGQKKLARTSAAPGRTRLVNYFEFGAFVLADLPGYGFAAVAKSEKEKWASTLDAFFKDKEKIAHVFMLVDSRHDPTADDVQMMNYLNFHRISFTIILTKSDKLSKMKMKENKKAIAADLYLGEDNLIATSAETKLGKEEVFSKVENILSLAEEKKKRKESAAADEGNEDDE